MRTLLWRKWSGEPELTAEEQRLFDKIKPEEVWEEWADKVHLLFQEAPEYIEDEAEDFGINTP